ncbi:hypothetical protein M2317_002631 [Microbacterium sp. ZKA21]|uniref:hypothetical protein n=1 Tax=Microbacterium sp. ZKA21 TaxID=3381694 RepID=UPI003D1FB057
MSARIRWLLVAAVAAIALGTAAVVIWTAWRSSQAATSAPSAVESGSPQEWDSGDRIVFRSTAVGQSYGLVASVAIEDPSGPRALTDVACDRVDAVADEWICLRTERGIATTFEAVVRSSDGVVTEQWPLPGIPSRTRISADGKLLATTAFVTGHSYATIGFSTETVIRGRDGESFGNLEDFAFIRDGAMSTAADRNFWGVTFAGDDRFYATAGLTLDGTTYLVEGDLSDRTLTTIAEGVECPSLSPDGSRIAFKLVTAGAGPTVHWTPAVLELRSGEVTVLPETRNIDDQIEWLDDSTILYGMPRDDAAGDSDVISLAADGSSEPELFIEHAWSPSVVRR